MVQSTALLIIQRLQIEAFLTNSKIWELQHETFTCEARRKGPFTLCIPPPPPPSPPKVLYVKLGRCWKAGFGLTRLRPTLGPKQIHKYEKQKDRACLRFWKGGGGVVGVERSRPPPPPPRFFHVSALQRPDLVNCSHIHFTYHYYCDCQWKFGVGDASFSIQTSTVKVVYGSMYSFSCCLPSRSRSPRCCVLSVLPDDFG